MTLGDARADIISIGRFTLIAFGITWICWGVRAALATGGAADVTNVVSQVLFFVGGFGPTLAAFAVCPAIRTLGGLRSFLFDGSIRSVGWLVALILGILAVFGLTSAGLNPAISLASVPVVLIAGITVSGGMSEELGWRGILQPEFERRLPYPVATLAVGLIWGLWHLPLWFTPGDSHIGFPFPLFVVQAILLSFWLAGLRRRNGSVMWCCVLHGCVNTIMSLFVLQLGVPLIAGLVLLTAASLVMGLSATKYAKQN